MSDIGGILGLFLGFSMLTVVEFIEFLVDMTVWCTMWLCYRDSWRQLTAAANAHKSKAETGDAKPTGSATEKAENQERMWIEDYTGDDDSYIPRLFNAVGGSDVELRGFTPPTYIPSNY